MEGVLKEIVQRLSEGTEKYSTLIRRKKDVSDQLFNVITSNAEIESTIWSEVNKESEKFTPKESKEKEVQDKLKNCLEYQSNKALVDDKLRPELRELDLTIECYTRQYYTDGKMLDLITSVISKGLVQNYAEVIELYKNQSEIKAKPEPQRTYQLIASQKKSRAGKVGALAIFIGNDLKRHNAFVIDEDSAEKVLSLKEGEKFTGDIYLKDISGKVYEVLENIKDLVA